MHEQSLLFKNDNKNFPEPIRHSTVDVVPLRDLPLLGFPLSRAHLLHLLPAWPGITIIFIFIIIIISASSSSSSSSSLAARTGSQNHQPLGHCSSRQGEENSLLFGLEIVTDLVKSWVVADLVIVTVKSSDNPDTARSPRHWPSVGRRHRSWDPLFIHIFCLFQPEL